MFLWEEAKRIKDAVGIPVVYIGGICSLSNMTAAMKAGFEFVQIGRATLCSSCSTTLGTVREPCCGRETSTVPIVGGKSWAPTVERYQHQGLRLSFRGDAVFAKPVIFAYLGINGIGYATRLPANAILEQGGKHLLKRPEGELPQKPVTRYHDFRYQAKN